jgi:hypothetical protein
MLAGSGTKVLLVDGHPLEVELVRDPIESEGIVVVHRGSAEEAAAGGGQ